MQMWYEELENPRFVETWYVGIVSFAAMVHQFVLVIAYLSGIQSSGMRTQMTWLEYYQCSTAVDEQDTCTNLTTFRCIK